MQADYIFEPKAVLELIKSIHESEDLSAFKGNAALPAEIAGPSGAKFRTLVSELNSRLVEGACYLELGILRGYTLLTSAVDNPSVKHIGVDNFSQFDPEGINASVVYNAISAKDLSNVVVIEDDFKT